MNNVIKPDVLIQLIQSNGSDEIEIIMLNSTNRGCINVKSVLEARAVTDSFNYDDYSYHFYSFIEKCLKRDKMIDNRFILNTEESIKDDIGYIKSFATDQRYSKEFDVLFGNYLSVRKRPDVQRKMQLTKKQDFYQCLVSKEREHIPKRLQCLNECFQSAQNTSKNLKPLSNSNHFNPSFSKNQIGGSNNEILSNALIIFTILMFSVIFLFICKFANKFLRKNKHINETLPVNRLRNRRPRRSNTKAQPPCSKLENCIRSCEQNCKRGH